MMQRGCVIQANERAGFWNGALLFVDEAKPWGVVAYMYVPNNGMAYVRLKTDEYEYIGKALFLPGDGE